MGRRSKEPTESVVNAASLPQTRRRRARSLEQREDQLIGLAYDLVEERMRNGTATSQETVEFLKRGSTKARLEKEMIEEEIKLKRARTEAMESMKRMEEQYAEAMKAFTSYRGTPGGKDEIIS